MSTQFKGLISGLSIALVAALLSGCAPSGQQLEVTDPWIKATDSGMTGMFATITNDGGVELSLVGASTDVAGMVEIHEVVDGVMQEKAGGVVVPAGGTAILEPGADHIMLMNLNQELVAGETYTVVLTFSDGSSVEVQAMARAFTGANEDYDPGHSRGEESDGHTHDGGME